MSGCRCQELATLARVWLLAFTLMRKVVGGIIRLLLVIASLPSVGS
jgi:hypothetical protein